MTTTSWRRAARRAVLTATLALGGPLLAPGAAAPAAAATLIQSCPYTVLAPGTYVLDRDLTCPGTAPAITIAADNVRLDLGGNTLTGDRDGDGILAEGTSENPITGLRVANGTVTDFEDGIELDFAPGARVAGVTASSNDDDGVDIGDSPGARVAGVTASDNGLRGINIDGSPGARLTGNTVERNDIEGINARDCDRCVIAGNRMADNGDRGLFFGGSNGARIEGNTITGNRSDGIGVVGSDTTGNLFRGNRLTGNGGSGIEVSAVNNRFEGNTATGNDTDGSGEADLVDLNLPEACVNTWRNNRFVTDNEEGAAFGPGAGCIR